MRDTVWPDFNAVSCALDNSCETWRSIDLDIDEVAAAICAVVPFHVIHLAPLDVVGGAVEICQRPASNIMVLECRGPSAFPPVQGKGICVNQLGTSNVQPVMDIRRRGPLGVPAHIIAREI